MKIAFISGINYPEFVRRGDIAFTLCDWALNDDKYVKYYRNINMYKITDNMAAENGVSSRIESVLKASRMLNTNEIWASDKLYDKNNTLKLTKEFISNLTEDDRERFNIVGIPQGKNFNEWIDCYQQMLDMPDINVIALSKYSCPNAFKKIAKTDIIGKARPIAINYLKEQRLIKKPLHLAGADNFIIEEIQAVRKISKVRSIDSNICFKLGVHKIKIENCIIEPKERLNHHIKDLTKQQISLIKYNIKKVREAL